MATLGGGPPQAPAIDFGAVSAQAVMPHPDTHAHPQEKQDTNKGKGDPGMLSELVGHFFVVRVGCLRIPILVVLDQTCAPEYRQRARISGALPHALR